MSMDERAEPGPANREGRASEALALIKEGVSDGDHHKMWLLDQVVRVLTGCPLVTRTEVDYRGEPYEYEARGESEEYRQFVAEYEQEYEWDEGIAP